MKHFVSRVMIYTGNPIESSPVDQGLQSLMHSRNVWTGTMGDLLENLQEKVSDQVKRSKFFLQDATRLGKTLIRLTPDLDDRTQLQP